MYLEITKTSSALDFGVFSHQHPAPTTAKPSPLAPASREGLAWLALPRLHSGLTSIGKFGIHPPRTAPQPQYKQTQNWIAKPNKQLPRFGTTIQDPGGPGARRLNMEIHGMPFVRASRAWPSPVEVPLLASAEPTPLQSLQHAPCVATDSEY